MKFDGRSDRAYAVATLENCASGRGRLTCLDAAGSLVVAGDDDGALHCWHVGA